MSARTIHQSDGLTVFDYHCKLGRADTPFLEEHRCHSISYVRKGSFVCHAQGRHADLVPGSVLLGYPGGEYMCSHEHHDHGDECLSFQFSGELAQELVGRDQYWRIATLPPLAPIMVLGQLAQAALEGRNDIGLDETGILMANRFYEIASGKIRKSIVGARHLRARIVEAALWIDANSSQPIDLEVAASLSGISPFHFLRQFAAFLGITPHQYLIRSRLGNAARLLAGDNQPVTEVALDVGFSDLSNFVRSFHRAAGLSPGSFRKLARNDRKIVQDRLGTATIG